MFAFKIVASLAVLLVAAVNASPADVAARQEQGFACYADGTVRPSGYHPCNLNSTPPSCVCILNGNPGGPLCLA
ncbi:hypothetical protein FB451DRAFT_1231763 [Mycena latifolia]|nr:hypothetical protein FB451DRAFT_1231763 [Mycena latifolia]